MREIVGFRTLSTPSDRLVVSTTDQASRRNHMGNLQAHTHPGHLQAPTHTGHLPARRHMGHLPAALEGELTRTDEMAGRTLRLSHIASVFAKACFFTLAVAALGGCSSVAYAPKVVVRTGTVRASTLNQMEALNVDRAAPVLIRTYKEESTLEVWKQDRSGKFALLKSYPICKFSGNLGPKLMQGDHQAPEGFYDIAPDQMNPNSSEYLALDTGFPNASIGLSGEPAVFLWFMAAVDPLVVTP